MLFSSFEFLYLFLPITLVAYFCARGRARNYVLLVASLVFYGIAQPKFLPLMVVLSLADYAFGIWIFSQCVRGKEKSASRICAFAVILNVAVLFVFKYLDAICVFFGHGELGIELPTGISFYIFQAMSYVIDVRRRAARVQKNPALFLTYVSLFPQLVAGPIVRYCEIDDALNKREHSITLAASGARLFFVGLAKKILLANGSGECFERMVRLSRDTPTVIGAWLGLVFFAFQIYFDFSGYSDMARGLGRIFGFEFPENFKYPYISKSITEFWRRWHITLSSWFREYVYIPLGGNRRGEGRKYFNLLCVWGITGIWHGASLNFLCWGLYFFAVLSLEKLFLYKWLCRLPSFFSHAYAIILILLGWLIFAADGTLMAREAWSIFMQMLGVGSRLSSRDVLFELLRNLPYLAIMAVAATPIAANRMRALLQSRPVLVNNVCNALCVLSLVICTVYLADSGYNPFLYFKF